MALLEDLAAFFETHGHARTYWIAYSGGMDSHVLLSLCHILRETRPLKLQAVYINHHLHPQSSAWEAHCEAVCRTLQVPFYAKSVDLRDRAGKSLEAFAREKRYEVLSSLLAAEDFLLTAHHEQDQAETVLLQLLRGAGPKGLSAMPPVKQFGVGYHARPFLSTPHQTLKQYASQLQLAWIHDTSNENKRFTRNFIRHDILPALMIHSAHSMRAITRSAAHAAEADALLSLFAKPLLEKMRGSVDHTLSVSRLLTLSPAEERLVLRAFIYEHGFLLPSPKKLEAIRQSVLRASPDRFPVVHFHQAIVRRYQDDLYLMPTHPTQPPAIFFEKKWHFKKEYLVIPGVGTVYAKPVQGAGLKATLSQVTVRFRRGGERLFLNGHHRSLKKLFQSLCVPPWKRAMLPLLFVEDCCIGMVGYAIDERYLASKEEQGFYPYCIASSANTSLMPQTQE